MANDLPAESKQSLQEIQTTAKQFLTQEASGIAQAKRVQVEIGDMNSRVNLAPCSAMEAFLPSGSRLWGKTSVGVRCLAPKKWTVFVPGSVKVWGDYYITTRAIKQGESITVADISSLEGELTKLPSGIVTEATQAVGRSSIVSLAAGMPLRQDGLRSQPVVLQGQNIQLLSAGQGFKVSTEGQALNNASEGQVVKVKVASGQVLSGIAKSGGIVEVR